MKKIFFTIVTLCGICVGTHSLQMNSAAAQTGTVTTTIIPLTNQVPFTNTVVPPTKLTTIQLSNVVTLLLGLQTNLEQTLPVLDLIQNNAIVVSVEPTNHLGITVPLTNIITNPTLTPTGAASGRRNTSLAVTIGTNTFGIDAPTLQALFILRDNLQQALTVLQALNGTVPVPTNSPPPSPTFVPPAVTNFSPGPLTNQLTLPPRNPPPFVMSNGQSPF
jgi:hypothetical protein